MRNNNTIKLCSISIQTLFFIILVHVVGAQDALYIQPNGNVGIGTTSPNAKLHIPYSGGHAKETLKLGGNETTYGESIFSIFWGGSGQLGMGPYPSNRGTFGRQGLGIHVSNTEEFTVKSSSWTNLFGVEGGTGKVNMKGSVGIGTNDPGPYQLKVNGTFNAKSGVLSDALTANKLTISGATKLNGHNLRVENDDGSGIIFVDSKNNQNWQVGTGVHGFYIFDNAYRFTVKKGTGLVGIGTSNPTKAMLEINGFSNPGGYHLFGFMDGAGNIANNNAVWGDGSRASIWASYEIVGSAIRVQSDRRIKTSIKEQGDNLSFVNKLRPVAYQYIDNYDKGDKIINGLIAQEVEKLEPDLINKTSNFIPNIYAKAEALSYDAASKNLKISTAQDHQTKVGDKVKIITEKKNLDLIVVNVLSDKEFVLEGCLENVDHAFIYGKEVHDFMTIDYNGVFTKGIGAIQELSGEVNLLKAENEQQALLISDLKNQINNFENQQKEIEELKANVMLIQNAMNGQTKETTTTQTFEK